MTREKKRALITPGTRLDDVLTVLAPIDPGSAEPVYMVWHHDAWCPMACKIMSSLDRALREAEKLKSLAHPAVVRLLDLREPGLLLMPFLEGPRLSDLIDKAPRKCLAVSDALRVAVYIGSALSHIHARGMVHLDIKPDNVIIAADGRPVVFDFGTARRLTDRRPETPSGTDAYIAPEECLLETAGPAADVFSLGVTLYETLSGTLPFGKGTAKAPFPQLTRRAASLRRQRRSIPARLENLVFACLEARAEFRPELPELLPQLNALITKGPRMWPEGFEPAGNAHALSSAKGGGRDTAASEARTRRRASHK